MSWQFEYVMETNDMAEAVAAAQCEIDHDKARQTLILLTRRLGDATKLDN